MDGPKGVDFGHGMGWLPDYPDFRDFTLTEKDVARRPMGFGETMPIKTMLAKMKVENPGTVSIPTSTDLREWCSPIEDQGPLGSCTAQAGAGLMEYYERRAFGNHIDASRLFLYKATRNLLHLKGDTGAYLRTTMAAMVLFGIPPEEYHPYIVGDFDEEPSSFCYAFGQNYQTVQYYRLDSPGTSPDLLLKRIKRFISARLPSMFGFTVFSSIQQAERDGKIPFPCPREKVLGGHAVVAVGFDDKVKILNRLCGAKATGALLIRNSWGTDWGEQGYGWLPYDYVLKGLAVDWWSILKSEWINTGRFGLGT